MDFSALGLSQPILRAVGAEGYLTPTAIQTQAIPHVLAGRDVFGCAQTGTGKTAAFALPILERLAKNAPATGKHAVQVLVLSPTRELAAQIAQSFRAYGRHLPLRTEVVFGGVGIGRQIQSLARGCDVLVATPGRLLDLMEQRAVTLNHLQVLVLDEADRMLDMGFIQDVKRIVRAVPVKRQTLLFSATLPESIRSLADSLLTSPVHVAVTPVSSAAETLDQSVYFVDKANKRQLLAWVLRNGSIERTLAFTRTKHGANRVVEYLDKSGLSAAAIHGNKSQAARERALAAFKRGQLRVLVATDIAARGIDIDQLSHVINFDLPNLPETYIHRIGRSGRAGATGAALSFCDQEERPYLRSIERLINTSIRVVSDHPHTPSEEARPTQPPQQTQQRQGGRSHSPERQAGRQPQKRHNPAPPQPKSHAPVRGSEANAANSSSFATTNAADQGNQGNQVRTIPKPGYSAPRRGSRTRQGGSFGRR